MPQIRLQSTGIVLHTSKIVKITEKIEEFSYLILFITIILNQFGFNHNLFGIINILNILCIIYIRYKKTINSIFANINKNIIKIKKDV